MNSGETRSSLRTTRPLLISLRSARGTHGPQATHSGPWRFARTASHVGAPHGTEHPPLAHCAVWGPAPKLGAAGQKSLTLRAALAWQ